MRTNNGRNVGCGALLTRPADKVTDFRNQSRSEVHADDYRCLIVVGSSEHRSKPIAASAALRAARVR